MNTLRHAQTHTALLLDVKHYLLLPHILPLLLPQRKDQEQNNTAQTFQLKFVEEGHKYPVLKCQSVRAN